MEQIEYTRTVVPSSMRSPYWKYFGFPSDSGNNILTRQKIVCTICNTAIAYNKNTSNLRTHLMSKHVEVFKNIVTPTSATMISKPDTSFYENIGYQVETVKNRPSTGDCAYNMDSMNTKRHRISTHDVHQSKTKLLQNFLSLSEYNSLESESNLSKESNLTMLTNKIDIETLNAEYNEYMSSNEAEMAKETDCTTILFNTSNVYCTQVENSYSDGDHNEYEQQMHSMDIMLADLIQKDLLPLEMLEEPGFCKYNHQLTGISIDADTIKRVKKIIETRFLNIKPNVNAFLYNMSQSQPYSLSFEIYKDNEAQDVLNIYFNYLNDKQMDLKSILFVTSVICTQHLNISDILPNINLKNCSGVVLSCVDDVICEFVSDFATLYDLPLIECLESILTRCLNKIFEQTDLYADYKQFLKIILEKENKIDLKQSNFKLRCKWTTFSVLDYIFQSVEQNILEQWNELRRSFEYMKPLKMALDIIMDEPLPLCSLTRPLIKKLFEEHFNLVNQGESRLSNIQTILEKELYERLIGAHFLTEATFFDTRFHRDFGLQEPLIDIHNLKKKVMRRFNHIIQVTRANNADIVKMEHNSEDSFLAIPKSSSLKQFFKRSASLTNTNVTVGTKTNLDLEFEHYYAQECLDLDQSPVLWWQQQSDNYKLLSKVAKYYLTIPCCCLPRLCRIDLEQRYLKLDRRKHLSQFCTIESKLWYLFYNEDVAELLEN